MGGALGTLTRTIRRAERSPRQGWGGTLGAGGDGRRLETGPGEGRGHGRPQPWSTSGEQGVSC